MTDEPREIESTDQNGRLDRRTMLKGVVAGLAGTATAGTASAQDNTIVLEAEERPVAYRIEVSGRIGRGEEAGQTDAIVHDHVAVGAMVRTDDLDDRRDSYRFTGEIRRLDVIEGSLSRVQVNGESVDPNALAGSSRITAVLEDFEDEAWPGDWVHETRGYSITDDALSGEFGVEANGSLGYPDVGKPTVGTPRGHTYTVLTIPGSDDAHPALLTNCQRREVMDDCYAAWLRTGLDELRLEVRSGGSGILLERVPTDRSLDPGSEYVIALDVGLGWVRARALTRDATQLATTDWHPDTTHTGGMPGLYTDGTSEGVAGTQYDQYIQWLLGSP